MVNAFHHDGTSTIAIRSGHPWIARMKKGIPLVRALGALAQPQTRSAADTPLQSIDLAVAAEELGADGANFPVHRFARQLASPFPLLAAVGAKTGSIESARR